MAVLERLSLSQERDSLRSMKAVYEGAIEQQQMDFIVSLMKAAGVTKLEVDHTLSLKANETLRTHRDENGFLVCEIVEE